jgi:hypothetical protein
MDREDFMVLCKERLGDDAKYYLPILQDYVFAVFKSRELAEELEDESATVKLTPRLKNRGDNEHSNPKVRMWALYRKEANELGKLLGLIPSKVGRPGKKRKAFDGPEMRLAK